MPRTLQLKSPKINQVLCGPVLSIKEDETVSFQTSVRTLNPDIGSCSHAPKALEKETEFDLALQRYANRLLTSE